MLILAENVKSYVTCKIVKYEFPSFPCGPQLDSHSCKIKRRGISSRWKSFGDLNVLRSLYWKTVPFLHRMIS
eukprot:COSAG02_NODE_26246_length_637_cov_1.312268_2_plen_71_part_01